MIILEGLRLPLSTSRRLIIITFIYIFMTISMFEHFYTRNLLCKCYIVFNTQKKTFSGGIP